MTTLYVRDQSGFREAQATDVFDRAQALLAQRYRIGSPVLTSPALRRLRCGVMRPGRRQPRLCRPRREPVMKNTIGRPRKLTDSQVKIILIWHASYLAWRALGNTLRSQRTLARELGVSQATISYVVRRGGEYKQVCPTPRAK